MSSESSNPTAEQSPPPNSHHGTHTAEDLSKVASDHIVNNTAAKEIASLEEQYNLPAVSDVERNSNSAQDTLAAEGQKQIDDTLGTSSNNGAAVHPGESFVPKSTIDIVPPEGIGLDSETTKESTTAPTKPDVNAEGNNSYTVKGREFQVGQEVEYTSEKGTTAKYTIQPRVGGENGTPDDQIVLKSVDDEQLQFATDNVNRIKSSDQLVDNPPDRTDSNKTSDQPDVYPDVPWGTPPHDPDGPFQTPQNPDNPTVYPDVPWRPEEDQESTDQGEDFVGYEDGEVNQDARDGIGRSEAEPPPEEPPTTPPAPTEPQEKHAFTIGHVGSAHHRLARDVAGREIQTDRYDAEGNLKGRWTRFKEGLGRLFKQGMFREPIEGKRTARAREEIRSNGHSQEVVDAIIAKIEAQEGINLVDGATAHVQEGLRLSGDVKKLDDHNPHYAAFEGEIKELLRSALGSGMPLDEFEGRAQALVESSTELTALLEQSDLFIDRRDLVERFGDLSQYLAELRGMANHEMALADIDENFEVIIAESGLGASSELARGSRAERALEAVARWSERHPTAGKLINETTIGLAVFTATKVLTSGAKFVAPVLSIATAAVLGAGRNNYHLRKDRILHARDVEMGEVSEYDEKDHSRRAQIDRSMYETLDVPAVLGLMPSIETAVGMSAESPELIGPEQVSLLTETLADIDARYEMQDQTGVGTFMWLNSAEAASLTDEQKLATVEQRKLSLALTRASMRTAIDKIAEARPDLFGVGEDGVVDTDVLMAAKLREANENLSAEKTEKDRVFHKLQIKTAGRTMATIAAIGTAMGWLTHEAQEWWAGGKGAGVGEHVPLQKEPVAIGDGRNVQLAEGLQMHPSSSGGGNFDIIDTQGHVVAANIHTGPSGVLSDESIAQIHGVKAGGGTLIVSRNNLETVAGPNVLRPATSDQALDSLRGTGELQHFARHFPGNEIDRYQLDLQPPRADGSIELTFTPKSAAAVADVRAGNGAALFTFKNAGLPADAPGAREGILVHLDTNGKAILTPDQFKGIDIAQTVARMGPDKYGAMPEGYIEAVGLHGQLPDGRFDLTSYATQRPAGGETFIPAPSTQQVGTAVIDIAKDPTTVNAPYIPITYNPDRALERIRHTEQSSGVSSQDGVREEELLPDYWAAGFGPGATEIGVLLAEGWKKQREQAKGTEPGSDEKLPVDANDPANLPAIINLMLSPDPEIRQAANQVFVRVMNSDSRSNQTTPPGSEAVESSSAVLDTSVGARQQFVDELAKVLISYSGKAGDSESHELSKQEKRILGNFRRGLLKFDEIRQRDSASMLKLIDARIEAISEIAQNTDATDAGFTGELDRLRSIREQVERYASTYQEKPAIKPDPAEQAIDDSLRTTREAMEELSRGEIGPSSANGAAASSLQPIDLSRALERIRETKNGLPMTNQEVGEFLGDIDRFVTIARIRFADDTEMAERAVKALESTRDSLLDYQAAKAGAGMTQVDLVREALEQTDKIEVLGVLDGIDKMPGGYIGSGGKKLSGQSIVRSISSKLRNINARAEAEEMTANDVYYVYSVIDTFRKYADRLTGDNDLSGARERYNVMIDQCFAYVARLMSGPVLAPAGVGAGAVPPVDTTLAGGEDQTKQNEETDRNRDEADQLDSNEETSTEDKESAFSDYKQGDQVVATLNNGKKAYGTVDVDQNQGNTVRVRLNDGSYQDMPPEQVEFRATS